MPIYEYKCDECGEIFTKIQLTYKEEKHQCPECYGDDTHRIPSVPAWRYDHTIKGAEND